MLKAKFISSLEKVFIDDTFSKFPAVEKLKTYKNQRLSFQLLYVDDDANASSNYNIVTPEFSGEILKYATIRHVECVANEMPVYCDNHDEGYLRTEPGLYPDVLKPLTNQGRLNLPPCHAKTMWFEINTNGALPAGDYTVEAKFKSKSGELLAQTSVLIHIIDTSLPELDFIATQWFHSDCLASYYNIEVFSERHWEIIENFMRTATKNGLNMILTPVITPAFDTGVGHYRPAVQLVDITREGDKYSYSYEKLDRWVDMAKRCGMKYFEIPPFFTQWGAEHAPQINATVGGELVRIFGWDTDSSSDEYRSFLLDFIPALVEHLKALGIDKKCYFHMSDEPKLYNIEKYKESSEPIRRALRGYTVFDALSQIEFYKQGLVDVPVVANNHIKPFLDEKVENLWTYYCCSQDFGVSNRFIAMPSARTRMIGAQMYKFGIKGFLQWGYNFYYNRFSYDTLNPYLQTSGELFSPGGDCFSVYPAQNGEAYESIRIIVFHEALTDMAAMKLCESYYGKAAVISALESVVGEIRFDVCPTSSKVILAMRDKIDEMIEAKL